MCAICVRGLVSVCKLCAMCVQGLVSVCNVCFGTFKYVQCMCRDLLVCAVCAVCHYSDPSFLGVEGGTDSA